MKMMLGALAVAGVGAGAYSTGAFEQGEYYEMAPQDVAAKLRSMQLPEKFAQLEGGNGDVRFRSLGATPEMARWDFTFRGEHLADITANLSPSGSGTNVAVSFEFAESPLARDMRQLAPIDNELIGQMVEIGVAEQIDATLDGRPFDERRMVAALTAYMIQQPNAMAGYAKDMQGMTERDIDPNDLDIDYSHYADTADYQGPGSTGSSDWGE